MSIEQPKIELQPQPEEVKKSEAESEPKQEKFDEFMVPESWIKDITEAQKEAYRMKVLARSSKWTREFMNPETKTGDDQPSPDDYKNAELVYRQAYEPGFYIEEGKLDKVINKTLDLIGGNIERAYIELRARMLARSERKEYKK